MGESVRRRELAARRELDPWPLDLLRRAARESAPTIDALRLGTAAPAATCTELKDVELGRERPEANPPRAAGPGRMSGGSRRRGGPAPPALRAAAPRCARFALAARLPLPRRRRTPG
jgi:hypothetical protein